MNSNDIALKSKGSFFKRRIGLAGGAAVAACAACCSIPVLVAAGVGGATLTTLAAHLGPGAELVAALGAAAAVLGITAVANRRRAAGCGDACSVTMATSRDSANPDASSAGDCGCAPTNESESLYRSPTGADDEAIVCTADLAGKPALQAQLERYRTTFAHLVRTERFTGGFRWVFRNEPGLDAHLKLLAENEHKCCRFFSFELTTTRDYVIWETRATAAAASVLEFFSRLPERLNEHAPCGADVAKLKHHAGAAGLEFAADQKQQQ